MPEIKRTYNVITDENGYYQKTQSFDDPLPWGLSVRLRAKITSPPNAHATCTVVLNNSNGKQSKSVTAQTGTEIDLGSWDVASGSDVLVLSGSTDPVIASATLTVDVQMFF